MLNALLASLLLGAPPAPAPDLAPTGEPCRALGPTDRVRVDLDDAPLATVAHLVSCALARNILVDPPMLGDKRVTVFGPTPVGRRDLEALWQAVLAAHGLIAERHGAFEVVRTRP